LTKGALFPSPGVKTVSRETYRVKQGQGLRSQRPGPFFGPRGGWALTYAPGRADRWPRTRQRGHLATDHGPGSAALVFVNLATGSQTRTGRQHKHKHGPGSSCATRQPPAAAARPARPAATGSSCATRSAGSHQAALGSHRHQVQAARTRQRGPGSGRQQITAAAALTWQQITASAAVTDQRITANQAARPTAQAATGSSCATQTRQQLRTDTRATFHASRRGHHAAGLAGGHAGQVSRHKPAATIGSRCDTRHKKTRHAAGFGSGERGQVRQAAQQLQPGWPASGRPCPGRRPYRL
jgi:hypothetical protein